MKIATVSYLLLALTLAVENSAARGAETNEVPRVGQLREFSHFTFKGNSSFSARSLWLGLNSTFNFPELSHPLAPRAEFLAAIRSQLRLGYHHCGFPHARVTARYDSNGDRVVVRVREGHRYRCGPVKVIGARKMPTQPIVTALTTTNATTAVLDQPIQFVDDAPANRTSATEADDSANQDFLWLAGQPAHFDKRSLRKLAGIVAHTLNRHGFYMSRFNLKVVPHARTRTATLRVRMLDEGPQATVNRIRVVGNHRNSRKAILKYLDLKRGMKFNRDLAKAINNRLYHSARFLTNSVSTGAPDSAGRITLTIHVVENDQCSPLGRALSPAEQTMLKARDWLAKASEGTEDAVLTVSGASDTATWLRFVLSPRQGLLILENDAVAASNQFDRALIMSPNQIALYDSELHQKFVAPHSSIQFKVWLAVATSAPAANGNSANLTFGAGFHTLDNSTSAPPFAFRMTLAPAAFVRLAHSTNAVCWFDGNELIRSNADTVLKLDARTGRIIEFTAWNNGPHHGWSDLRFQSDVFASTAGRVERRGAGYLNVYDTNSPLGSAISFFGSELVQSKFVAPRLRARLPAVTCAQLPALLHKFGNGEFLAPFKRLKALVTPPEGPAGQFVIPKAPRPEINGDFAKYLAVCAQWIFEGGDKMFPVNSWPWTVARDAAFLSRNQNRYLLPDLVGIYRSDDCGPIGCLTTAWMLKASHSPLAKDMARRGLERLSADDFRHDCRLFLDEKTFSGQFMVALAGVLDNLNQQELDALTAPMPGATADFIRDCARRLHAAGKEQPLSKTIAPALDAWWKKALKQQVAGELRRIAKE